MTMKVSKCLGFLMVALPGVGHMPWPGEEEKEAAWVFYVDATRATQRLVIGVGGDGGSSGGLVYLLCSSNNAFHLRRSGKMKRIEGIGKNDVVKKQRGTARLAEKQKTRTLRAAHSLSAVQKFGG